MEGLASAIRIMKESHADALKLEGGEEIIDTVKRIISAGIPVMGHLGLMPQSINKYGTYTVRAKDDNEAEKLIRDAHLLEEAGCFAIVLEKIPATLAERVASELTIPIIGIGAGGHVDGQVLVIQDMLGMNNGFRPRFLRRYADLYTVMTDAISRYVSDVNGAQQDKFRDVRHKGVSCRCCHHRGKREHTYIPTLISIYEISMERTDKEHS